MNRKKEKQSVRHRHIVMSRFFFFVYRLAHFAALAFFFPSNQTQNPYGELIKMKISKHS